MKTKMLKNSFSELLLLSTECELKSETLRGRVSSSMVYSSATICSGDPAADKPG